MSTSSHDSKVATLQELVAAIANADGSTFAISSKDEEKAKVRNKALRLLNQRDRSREELRERLARDEQFPAALIHEVLDDLTSARLLNDENFAHEWVRQRSLSRGKSRAVLDQELKRKGISDAVRHQALSQVTDNDEATIAMKLAEKKARTVKAKPESYEDRQKDLRKVVGVLARRGFPQSMAMNIARDALENRYAELASVRD